MKKRLLICGLALALILLLASCGCDHEWNAATCTAPKTCQLCGETEGEALGHTWQEADCLNSKTCTVCKVTEGEVLGHTWQEADCLNPKTCTACKITEGEALGHDWQEATTEAPQTCSRCSLTEGERLITDPRFTTASTKALHGVWTGEIILTAEMMGVEKGFEDGVPCLIILEFSKTGEITAKIELTDPDGFQKEFASITVQLLYDTFEQQGLGKEEVDALMQDEYGMTVEAYVEEQLKGYDLSAMFDMYKLEGFYYVEEDQLYTGYNWDDSFDSSKYTFADGVLTIEEFFLGEDGEPLSFTKAD